MKKKESPSIQFRLASDLEINKAERDNWRLISDKFCRGNFEPELMKVLRRKEFSITGKELMARLPKGVLGQLHAEAMLANQDIIPKKWRQFALIFATVWQVPTGHFFVPYLYWGGKKWHMSFYWLGGNFGLNDRIVWS